MCITATEPNRTEPIRTEPNRTEPNQTEPNRTVVVIHAVPGDVCRMTPGHAIPPCRAPGGEQNGRTIPLHAERVAPSVTATPPTSWADATKKKAKEREREREQYNNNGKQRDAPGAARRP